MFDATSVKLSDLKAIRKAVPGCTINDIVLSICGGAVRKYLQHHIELPKESLVAWVPINARSGPPWVKSRALAAIIARALKGILEDESLYCPLPEEAESPLVLTPS